MAPMHHLIHYFRRFSTSEHDIYPQLMEKKSPFKPSERTLCAMEPQPNTTRRKVPAKFVFAALRSQAASHLHTLPGTPWRPGW